MFTVEILPDESLSGKICWVIVFVVPLDKSISDLDVGLSTDESQNKPESKVAPRESHLSNSNTGCEPKTTSKPSITS